MIRSVTPSISSKTELYFCFRAKLPELGNGDEDININMRTDKKGTMTSLQPVFP